MQSLYIQLLFWISIGCSWLFAKLVLKLNFVLGGSWLKYCFIIKRRFLIAHWLNLKSSLPVLNRLSYRVHLDGLFTPSVRSFGPEQSKCLKSRSTWTVCKSDMRRRSWVCKHLGWRRTNFENMFVSQAVKFCREYIPNLFWSNIRSMFHLQMRMFLHPRQISRLNDSYSWHNEAFMRCSACRTAKRFIQAVMCDLVSECINMKRLKVKFRHVLGHVPESIR